ncbi:MAG TPA: leucyl aminopeptidase [Chitinophagales bacterium]|nr:leucyl aminopeptidase [Chitinophagales bacterium]
MPLQLLLCKDYTTYNHNVVLIDEKTKLSSIGLAKPIAAEAESFFSEKGNTVFQQQYEGRSLSVVKIDTSKEEFKALESARKAGNAINKYLNGKKIKEASVLNASGHAGLTTAFAEGAALSNYEFLKYKTKEKREKSLATLHFDARSADKNALDEVSKVVTANFFARTLINEPLSYLTATQLSKDIQGAGKKYGFSVTVFDKKKIEQLKMGGLLSVNKGSVDPPTFTIMEYKGPKAKNKKPVVLVGKGVVYDTGGLSLKPTPNSMDMMKCDMSGAALVAGVFVAAALLKLPVHIVGLIPATDNRPGGNAYVPGDVVTMMSGLNVEMLNADAEGRMILADALHYAKKYSPELVFDFATLTGAAKAATSSIAAPFMGTAADGVKSKLLTSANNTYERLIEFPLWDEYGDLIKSDVADIKNVGGPEAGSITAGKFLEHFTSYPWMHFDIAGTAYLMSEDSYKGKYGTAYGVRLITDFLKNY